MRNVLLGGVGLLSFGCGMNVDSKQDLQGTDSALLTDTATLPESDDDGAGSTDGSGAGSSDGSGGSSTGADPSEDENGSGSDGTEGPSTGPDRLDTGAPSDGPTEFITFTREVISTKRGASWLTPIDGNGDGYVW